MSIGVLFSSHINQHILLDELAGIGNYLFLSEIKTNIHLVALWPKLQRLIINSFLSPKHF